MSEEGNQVDNWVFDSLVNFLHGSIWKVPVVGFIEEKSVVFDPDSYNNMTDEKEQEFRKIHEEYKAVVDFMLSSFMEDLQVTPEQVEEACRVREHQSKTLPESHITKVALEQLWAAEDFTAFRRLMTRKNIDLQLQSLELLVAKYGVLSPALRSGDSEEPTGEDGEDDFLQVVIRYSDQLELFKFDYGADAGATVTDSGGGQSVAKGLPQDVLAEEDDESKNMKLHLSGIRFKNDAPTVPVQYQATLTSSTTSLRSSTSSSSRPNSMTKLSRTKKQVSREKSKDRLNKASFEDKQGLSLEEGKEVEVEMAQCLTNTPPPPPTTPSQFNEDIPSSLSIPFLPEEACLTVVEDSISDEVPEEKESSASPTPPHVSCTDKSVSPSPETQISSVPPSPSPTVTTGSPEAEPEESPNAPNSDPTEERNGDGDGELAPTIEPSEITQESEENANGDVEPEIIEPEPEKESQLIQLEEAEAIMEGGGKVKREKDIPEGDEDEPPTYDDTVEDHKPPAASALLSPNTIDEKTVAEIASTAPEQRRLLTAVRKALEINPDDSESSVSTIDIPSTLENDEDLQKRREYLRAQRDKLIAIKKQEREKLLLANTSASGGSQQPARPKSARAAQIAIKNPGNMRQASLSEKSLSARRALADRLKQELIEK